MTLLQAGAGIAAELVTLLTVFLIAAGVGTLVAKVGRFPYTIALLLAGLVVSITGVEIGAAQDLSHDLILLVVLPALLFEGAATTDLERFRRNVVPILTLAVPGLIVSVLLLGYLGSRTLGFPLMVSLLFAAMILPTDPVSVLALFKELGVPDRLGILTRSDAERLYQLLVGRSRAVSGALDAVERLRRQGDVPGDVYEDFRAEYGRERDALNEAITELFASNPELRHERVLVGERQVLRREKSALLDAVRSGVVADVVPDG